MFRAEMDADLHACYKKVHLDSRQGGLSLAACFATVAEGQPRLSGPLAPTPLVDSPDCLFFLLCDER